MRLEPYCVGLDGRSHKSRGEMVEFVGRFRGEVRRSASAAYALVDFGMTLKIVEQRCCHYLALRQYFDSGGYVLPYLGQ